MSTRTNVGSAMARLEAMRVGEVLYVETTQDGYAKDMRAYNPPKKRRTEVMKDWVFTTQKFVALPTFVTEAKLRYLIAVERVK